METPCPARRVRGFTLVEMVTIIVIIGVLVAATAPLFVAGIQAHQATSDHLETLTKLRYAVERMALEIREVARDPITPTNYAITMALTQIVFTKTDGNQVTITGAPPLVTLGYTSPVASATLSNQVSTLGFRYFEINGTETADPALVAFVEIDLTLIEDGVPINQRTRVALRNQQ